MYIKTIITQENCPDYANYLCDICNTKMSSGEPQIEKQNVNICEKCIFDMAEAMIKLNVGGWKLFWLEEMTSKYFKYKRKKRNCYLSKRLRNEILKKYKFTCQLCGTKENLTIDHIKPVIKGGTDEASNLTVLCKSCNSKKGSKYENK